MTTTAYAEDQARLRRLFSRVPTAVAAVAALADGNPVAMAATSFTLVSLDPPLISVAVQTFSKVWERLRKVEHVGITLLSDTQASIFMQLSMRGGDCFDGVPFSITTGGALYIASGVCTLDCSLYHEVKAGDHIIAVFEIREFSISESDHPLIFHP